jgi:tetratricopeptide (TPR) repeat protein
MAQEAMRKSNSMKNSSPQVVLVCIYTFMLPIVTFGRQTANSETNAQNAVTYVDRGLAKEKKGDLNGAFADFNQAIKLNSRYPAAYDRRGVVKFKKGDLDGAMADYNQAIQLNPKYAGPYNNRGVAKFKKGDLGGAIADYNQAIQLNPKYGLAYRKPWECQEKERRRRRSHNRLQSCHQTRSHYRLRAIREMHYSPWLM